MTSAGNVKADATSWRMVFWCDNFPQSLQRAGVAESESSFLMAVMPGRLQCGQLNTVNSNVEVRGASRLAGEASLSTAGLGGLDQTKP